MLKSYNSKKLFWNQYLYKITIKSQLSTIFRNNKLLYARKILDELQVQADKGHTLTWTNYLRGDTISLEHFEKAKLLHQLLSNSKDYMLRVEKPHVQLYSNDINWLENIGNRVGAEELVAPDPSIVKFLNIDENIVVLEKDNGCKLRVTLGIQNNSNWADWILANDDKVKIGPVLKAQLKGEHRHNFFRYKNFEGLYFYVRDEKILQMISLLGVNIRRVDKIVCKENLDK